MPLTIKALKLTLKLHSHNFLQERHNSAMWSATQYAQCLQYVQCLKVLLGFDDNFDYSFITLPVESLDFYNVFEGILCYSSSLHFSTNVFSINVILFQFSVIILFILDYYKI